MSPATGRATWSWYSSNTYSKGEEEVPQRETMLDYEHSKARLVVPTASRNPSNLIAPRHHRSMRSIVEPLDVDRR